MKVPVKQRILDYLGFKQGYCSGLELEMQAYNWRSKPSTIARRCRELADSGAIERTLQGKTVQYRKTPPPTIVKEVKVEQEILF